MKTKLNALFNLKTMQLFLALFVFALIQAPSSNIYAQKSSNKISLHLNNVMVEDVLNQIEKQSSYRFIYDKNLVNINHKVSVSANKDDVRNVLDKIFNGNPSYVIKNNQIILINNTQPKSTGNKKAVAGEVYDEKGNSLVGAYVSVKNTKNITTTDIDGKFSLNNVPDNSTLSVSYIGYITRDIKATKSNLDRIILKVDSKLLDEVVVVGYGKQSEKLVTTSISSVKLDNIDQGNDYNVAKLLQGRTPGINISTPSGIPGQQPNVRVRGIASISGSATPLYVVDGVPSDNMPYLNPNDIDRVDILKDASATAIYGSRANNGVIIITTKSGALDGKTRINASARHSLGWIAHDIKMANSEEYARTIKQAMDNYNTEFAGVKTPAVFVLPDNMPTTDWVGLLERDVAQTTNANINLSGGNKATTFFVSVGYNGQEGILRKTSFKQTNARAKFSHIINRFFKLNLNLSGSYTKEQLSEESDNSLKIIRSAREQQPWFGPYDENGNYTSTATCLLRHNPVAVLNEENLFNHRYEGIGSFNIEITPFKGFKYTPSLSLYGKLSDGKKTITEKHPRYQTPGWGAVSQSRNTTYRIVFDNVFSYDNSVDRLMYNVMLGHSYEKYAYSTFGAISDNYKGGAYPSSSFGLIDSGTAIYPGSIGYNAYAIESYFGRIALNWDNRYILNASLRSDGSSRFPKNQRYGTFPSASFAWRISNEGFYPKGSTVNDLKLRLSWGNTGSMAGISDWSAMSLISSSSSSSYNGSAGFIIGNTAGNLTWEKSRQFNVGVDAEMFDSRLRFNLDAYYQKTYGLLYGTNLIATSGYSSRTANRGKIENKGLEFAVSGDIIRGDFSWDASANISYTKNKLLELDGILDMEIRGGSGIQGGTYHALIVGKPVSAYYMYQMDGLYQKDIDVPSKLYAKGVRAGDCKYRDINNDGDITADDRMYTGKVTPDFTGGITSNMKWKNFDFTVFCQYAVGGKILAAWRGCGSNEGAESLGYGGGSLDYKFYSGGKLVTSSQYYNSTEYVSTHYWNGEGTSNSVPRPVLKGSFTGGFANYLPSTRYLEDASYFKFKTITLGYSLPKSLLASTGISNARIYVSLDNFFTISGYSGYDPEFSYSSTPSSSAYGADFGEQATLKSVILGASINF